MNRIDNMGYNGVGVAKEIQDIFDEKGIRVYIYTVNDPEEASYYREEGAAGVCSDSLVS